MVQFEHFQCPLHRYTFSVKPIRQWVEQRCEGQVLNLFAGQTLLQVPETRNDLDPAMPAHFHLDALEFLRGWQGESSMPLSLIRLMLIVRAWKCTRELFVALSAN